MSEDTTNFGGGIAAYREFLIRTEGKADVLKYTLSEREKFFDMLESNPLKAQYRPNKGKFYESLFTRKFDSTLDRKTHWLIATAKLNQSERFGVGLGEAYGKDQHRFKEEPELMYVQLQEHYHTRILGDVVRMFDLDMPSIPPTFMMRQLVKAFVMLPHDKTLMFVAASEIVGCRLFATLRDEGVKLFADEPIISSQIEKLYNEIIADEIGHVGFLAAKLSPIGRAIARWLSKNVVWSIIVGSVPELTHLFGKDEFRKIMHEDFDVENLSKSFPERSYGAASIL